MPGAHGGCKVGNGFFETTPDPFNEERSNQVTLELEIAIEVIHMRERPSLSLFLEGKFQKSRREDRLP